jgi:hypothetical protein
MDYRPGAVFPFWQPGNILEQLIERYASTAVSGRILAEVKVSDKIGKMACQPQSALLAYFLRADPAVAGPSAL